MLIGQKKALIMIGLGLGVILGFFAPAFIRDDLIGVNRVAGAGVQTESDMEGQYYHFVLENGALSVVQGRSGEDGLVVIQNLDIQTWNPAIMDLAQKVELHSLDEVQSFIDSIDEALWQE